MVKNLPALQKTRVRSWVRKILRRREWQPTPVSLPGESQGQRSLAGYSPWGHKELDMTEHTHTHTCTFVSYSSFFSEVCGEINHRLVTKRMNQQTRLFLVLMVTVSEQTISDKSKGTEAKGLPGSDLRSQ